MQPNSRCGKSPFFFFQDSCLRLISDELKHNILDVFSMKLEYAENMMFKWNHDFYFTVFTHSMI